MSIKELEKYMKLCRKHGVLELRLEGVELKLDAHAPITPRKLGKAEKQAPATDTASEGSYSEEDALFWSSTPIAS